MVATFVAVTEMMARAAVTEAAARAAEETAEARVGGGLGGGEGGLGAGSRCAGVGGGPPGGQGDSRREELTVVRGGHRREVDGGAGRGCRSFPACAHLHLHPRR